MSKPPLAGKRRKQSGVDSESDDEREDYTHVHEAAIPGRKRGSAGGYMPVFYSLRTTRAPEQTVGSIHPHPKVLIRRQALEARAGKSSSSLAHQSQTYERVRDGYFNTNKALNDERDVAAAQEFKRRVRGGGDMSWKGAVRAISGDASSSDDEDKLIDGYSGLAATNRNHAKSRANVTVNKAYVARLLSHAGVAEEVPSMRTHSPLLEADQILGSDPASWKARIARRLPALPRAMREVSPENVSGSVSPSVQSRSPENSPRVLLQRLPPVNDDMLVHSYGVKLPSLAESLHKAIAEADQRLTKKSQRLKKPRKLLPFVQQRIPARAATSMF